LDDYLVEIVFDGVIHKKQKMLRIFGVLESCDFEKSFEKPNICNFVISFHYALFDVK
jgi:hypothetical protein